MDANSARVPSEEAYVLRVQDPGLASQIKAMLRDVEAPPNKLEIRFKSDREGTFVYGDRTLPVCVGCGTILCALLRSSGLTLLRRHH